VHPIDQQRCVVGLVEEMVVDEDDAGEVCAPTPTGDDALIDPLAESSVNREKSDDGGLLVDDVDAL
jgi:hypothetical protein